ncbi:MAG: hypothetical protein SGJ07_03510 [Rhodospirillaceae bacterium]|nr:hypothetical protein [Rhodospirillaceae bacterium]
MKTIRLGMLAAPLAFAASIGAASIAAADSTDYSSPIVINTVKWYNVPVMNMQGAQLGSYNGLVNAHGGSVYYVLVKSATPQATVWAVPSNYLQVDPTRRILIMDVQPEIFVKAPVYTTDLDLDNEEWSKGARTYYQENAFDYGDFGAVDSSRSSSDTN